jgi:threonine synthase
MTTLTHLECTRCGASHDAARPRNLCDCGAPLMARYDLERARESWSREWIDHGPSNIWRYAPVLPVASPAAMVSLGEGLTPLVALKRLGDEWGASDLWLKDDGVNPTGSFKARGLACAVSKALELGVPRLAVASAGNAASALAAYAAAAGLESHIFMPSDVPQSNYLECRAFGAHVTLVDGLIGDCAKAMAARVPSQGWFDMNTFHEPYRVEGKKTMGYELAEQFRWTLPDAILYPTGGGVGLIGMWKAFEELETLGWVAAGKRPRMIAVQADGCRPLVDAVERGEESSRFYEGAHTLASGLRVPKSIADFLVLRIIKESRGTAVAVSDQQMLDSGVLLAGREGIFAAPEGAACVAAARALIEKGVLDPASRIVIYNTGAGLKYLEAYSTRFPRMRDRQQDKLGGLITPR